MVIYARKTNPDANASLCAFWMRMVWAEWIIGCKSGHLHWSQCFDSSVAHLLLECERKILASGKAESLKSQKQTLHEEKNIVKVSKESFGSKEHGKWLLDRQKTAEPLLSKNNELLMTLGR